jgi:adenylate cyclase
MTETAKSGAAETPPKIDYRAEGLLDDVLDEAGIAPRVRLLDYLLYEEGVPFEDVKAAAQEKRLVLLPLERALGGEPCFTALEVAERAEVDVKLLLELRGALGLAQPPMDQRVFSEYDVGVMKSVKHNIELGMPLDGIREINRVLGGAMSQLAATVERIFLSTFLQPDDDEHSIAVRYGQVARTTSPEFGFVLQHIFNLHLREATRSDILGNEATMDLLSDARVVSVCFADLVGFTSLGEQIPADELGAIAERLNEIAVALVEPPVRLVKTIGDAVMLAAPEPDALLNVALRMVDVVEQEDGDFPSLSVGIDIGETIARGGDIYGPPVNHASRICDAARAGSVVTSKAVRDLYPDDYDWTPIGRRRFKGLEKPIELYRARVKGTRPSRNRRTA